MLTPMARHSVLHLVRPVLCLVFVSGCLGSAGAQSELRELRDRVAELESIVSQLDNNVATVQNDGNDTRDGFEAMQQAVEDHTAAIASLETQAEESMKSLEDHKSQFITEHVTWTVGPSSEADFPDMAAVWTAIHNVSVLAQGLLTIQLEDGVHTVSRSLSVNHSDGVRIQVVGNAEDPLAVTLKFSGTYGFVLPQAPGLYSIESIVLDGDARTSYGIYAQRGAAVQLDAVTVRNFTGAGLLVQLGGAVTSTPGGLVATENVGSGVAVQLGGTAYLPGLNASDNGVHGAYATFGGVLRAQDSTYDNNGEFGAYMLYGGIGDLRNSQSTRNGVDGFHFGNHSMAYLPGAMASENGAVGIRGSVMSFGYAHNSTSTDNLRFGYVSANDSYLSAVSGVASGNTDGDFSPDGGEGNQDSYLLR